MINTSAHAYSAALRSRLPHHPLRDFGPGAALTSQPYVLGAEPRSSTTSATELTTATAARPGEVRFASAGVATGTHLAVETLNRDLGITALQYPPRGKRCRHRCGRGYGAGLTAYAMLPIPTAAPRLDDDGLVALGSAQRAPHGYCRMFRRSRRPA